MRINTNWLLRRAVPLLPPIAVIGLFVRDYLLDHGPTGLPNDLRNGHNKPGELKVFVTMVMVETVVAYWLLYPREEALWRRALAATGLFLLWSVVNVLPIMHAGGIMLLHLCWVLLLTVGCFAMFATSGLRALCRQRAPRSVRTV